MEPAIQSATVFEMGLGDLAFEAFACQVLVLVVALNPKSSIKSIPT